MEDQKLNFSWFFVRTLVFLIPLIGPVMAVFWAFAAKTPEGKAYARAVLVIYAVLAVVGFVTVTLLGNYLLGLIKTV